MRYVVVCMSLSRKAGGLFTSVRRLTQELTGRFSSVAVISSVEAGFERDVDFWKPLAPIILQKYRPYKFGFMPKMVGAIIQSKPDILHIHGVWSYHAWAVVKAVKKLTNCTVVVSPRGMLDSYGLTRSRFFKYVAWHTYVKHLITRADYFHALNSREALHLHKLNIPEHKIIISPNGVDAGSAPKAKKNREKIKIGYIGRIHHKKGLEDLIKIAVCLKEKGLLFELKIAGFGGAEYISKISDLILENKLKNEIKLVGPVYGSDKEIFLNEMEYFIFPTKSEGMPMVVLECWAAGVIVISNENTNMSEFGNYPFAVSANNGIESYVSAMMKLVSTRKTPEDLEVRKAAYVHVINHYSWDKIAEQLERQLNDKITA